MKLDAINGSPISIDGEPFCQNLQVQTFSGSRQIRIKADMFQGSNKTVPIDVVVLHYTDLMLSGTSLNVIIEGRDMIRNMSFRLRVSYNVITKMIAISGTCGRDKIEQKFHKDKSDLFFQVLVILRKLCGIN